MVPLRPTEREQRMTKIKKDGRRTFSSIPLGGVEKVNRRCGS